MSRPIARRRPDRFYTVVLPAAVALVAAITYLATVTLLPATLALFTAPRTVDAAVGAASIFRAERVTPAFALTDHSSGAPVDASSATAFTDDGRVFVSRPWSATFDDARYVELDLNAPLPLALAVSDAQLSVRLASDAGGATACYYVQLRRASDGSLLSSHGSAASPLDCVNGTTLQTKVAVLPAVDGTDLANDLRVRLVATDSLSSALRIDAVTITAATPHASFTLYPVLTREAYGGSIEVIPWGPAGP